MIRWGVQYKCQDENLDEVVELFRGSALRLLAADLLPRPDPCQLMAFEKVWQDRGRRGGVQMAMGSVPNTRPPITGVIDQHIFTFHADLAKLLVLSSDQGDVDLRLLLARGPDATPGKINAAYDHLLRALNHPKHGVTLVAAFKPSGMEWPSGKFKPQPGQLECLKPVLPPPPAGRHDPRKPLVKLPHISLGLFFFCF